MFSLANDLQISGCLFYDDRLYDVENHIWVKKINNHVEIGIDSVMNWMTGQIRSLSISKKGEYLHKGKVFGSLESSRHFDVLRSPISGLVTEVNSAALNDPIIVNRDPYIKGWLLRARPNDFGELQTLSTAEEAKGRLEELIKFFNIRCFKEFPDIELFEIGVECSATLVKLNELMNNSKAGTVVHIVTDDPTADIEMIRWADQTGNLFLESRAEGNLRHLLVKKRG